MLVAPESFGDGSKPGESRHDETAEPAVSVIVPCYNSARTIRPCLSALTAQQTSAVYDITVVDSSADETASIVTSEFPSVRLIRLEKRTFAGAARNVGVRATKGRLCLMIDSDCIAEPDVVERMIARHREDQFAAVGGSLANGTPRSISGCIGYLMEFKEYMPTCSERIEKTVPSANVAYRREALFRHGLFDDDMWLAEDILFNSRISRAGDRILFDPSIKVTHLNRTGWRQVLSYQVDLGRLSAVARRRGKLPGRFLMKYPALIALMPAARLLRAFKWLWVNDRKVFALLLLIWPAYLLAGAFWSFGFLDETLSMKYGRN